MSQPKVFEFAKEIGMSPLALMDKIREWKLPVRSHMAELEPEVLEQIKVRLNSPAEAEAQPAKKKVVKKAAAASAEAPAPAAKKPAKKAAAAPSAAPRPANAKTGVKGKEAEVAGVKKGVVVKKAAAKVVVRKKVDEEELAAQEASEKSDEVAHVPDAEHVAPIAAALAEPEVEPAQHIPEVQVAAQPLVVAQAVAAPLQVQHQPTAPAPQGPVAAAPNLAAAPATAAATGAPGTPVPGRKREVTMTSHGPVSGVKSDQSRRNIIGRMDLSRVQGPTGGPGGRPGGGFPSSGASRPGGGFPSSGASRPGGTSGPRPLRAGFVSSAPLEVEDEATIEARRRFDEKKKVRAGAPGGPGGAATGREKEEEVVAFTATEFRKREMVFQPKKKKGMLNREAKATQLTKPRASKRVVRVNKTMKLSDLANEMGLKAGLITKALMTNGVTASMNTDLDFDTIALIVPEFGFEAVNAHQTVDQIIESTAFGEMTAAPLTRPPVVTIMGHVDHGKTSLLDAIRKAKVAAGEAGGITQHIGAYQVTSESGGKITFIDTPGHEAFTAMRARGANVTDIVVVVVAADDGVMPQTVEAVSHAKAAGVPIIVAINKMDKPGANPDKIKQQLTEQQLVPEEWGGDTIYVPVSAVSKEGIPALLEQINLVAEVEELTANPKRSATGVVIESRIEKGRGTVATLLVHDGTLKVGQSIVAGGVAGRVRSLTNDRGERVTEAGPSVPVEVLGLSEVPQAGDKFDVVVDDQAAERIALERRSALNATQDKGKISLEDLFSKMKQGDLKELPIILKTDVAGSVEAIRGMLDKVGTDAVKIKLVHSAVGGINESDVLLASTAKGIIVGFNVHPDGGAQTAAKRLGVEIKTYTIVYEMIDDLKKAMAGLLTPNIIESQLGRAEVRNVFTIPKAGTIAGSFVVDGKITRSSELRLVRDGKIIYTGKISSLKRFKDDAREVAQGYECGIGIENFNDIKVGDVIEAFERQSVVREL